MLQERVTMTVVFIPKDELSKKVKYRNLNDDLIDDILSDFTDRLERASEHLQGFVYVGHGPVFDDDKGY
jgi:hypothetical protein